MSILSAKFVFLSKTGKLKFKKLLSDESRLRAIIQAQAKDGIKLSALPQRASRRSRSIFAGRFYILPILIEIVALWPSG